MNALQVNDYTHEYLNSRKVMRSLQVLVWTQTVSFAMTTWGTLVLIGCMPTPWTFRFLWTTSWTWCLHSIWA